MGELLRHFSRDIAHDSRPTASTIALIISWIDTRVILRKYHWHYTPRFAENFRNSGNLLSKRPYSIFQMDPQAPSQPSIDTAYDNPDNPIDQTSSERREATSISASQQRSDPTYERRGPNDTIGNRGSASQNEATPSSLGYGARDSSGDAGESVSATLEALAFRFGATHR